MVQYSTVGRIIGVLGVLGLPTYAVFNSIGSGTDPKLGWAEVTFFCFSSFVLGIVEIPMLCACYDWCRVLAKYTRPIAGLWVGRAVVHLLVAAGILGIGVNQGTIGGKNGNNAYVYVFGIAFLLSCLAYLVGALYKKEPPPFEGDGAKSGAGKEGAAAGGGSGSSAAEDAGGFFGRLLAKKAAENPAAASAFVGAAVGAAAPSAGTLMFGGGGSSSSGSGGGSGSGSGSKDNSPKESASKGFYGDEEAAPADKASLFNGGGLFGGSASGNNSSSATVSSKSAKYGVSSSDGDDFEAAANPFMS